MFANARARIRMAMAAAAAAASAGQYDIPDVFGGPTTGIENYRGRGGNRAHQRAAVKARNRAKHRKACRG